MVPMLHLELAVVLRGWLVPELGFVSAVVLWGLVPELGVVLAVA